MNVLSIIRETLTEIMLIIIFIPKTFVRAILNPAWPFKYVADELVKSQDQQFIDYSEPTRYFILLGCVPACLNLSDTLDAIPEMFYQTTIFGYWSESLTPTQKLTSAAFVVGLLPMCAAFTVILFAKMELNRKELVLFYNIFSYQVGTLGFASTILWSLHSNRLLAPIPLIIADVIHQFALLLMICLWLWMLYSNTRGLAEITHIASIKAASSLLCSFLIWLPLTFCLFHFAIWASQEIFK